MGGGEAFYISLPNFQIVFSSICPLLLSHVYIHILCHNMILQYQSPPNMTPLRISTRTLTQYQGAHPNAPYCLHLLFLT